MTIKGAETAGTEWRSAEFELGRFQEADLDKLPDSTLSTPAAFLDWLFNTEQFAYAVLIDRPWLSSLVAPGAATHWPHVVIGANEARPGVAKLAEAGMRGFQLIVGCTCEDAQLADFLATRGYQNTGVSRYGSGEAHDIATAPCDEPFPLALTIAMRLGAQSLCAFAHDADPVYVMNTRLAR